MYKFITVARNMTDDTSPMPMYIYQNEQNNKYYISRMFPTKAIFQGTKLINENKFYAIDYPQEISSEDISKGKTVYWKTMWSFKM
jgi:hypothetical protein